MSGGEDATTSGSIPNRGPPTSCPCRCRRRCGPRPPRSSDQLWYKDAVIYQAHVRAFLDSTNDGVRDFRGFTQKLEYLESLGIHCVWLLPFYPSPLKDDGYDI